VRSARGRGTIIDEKKKKSKGDPDVRQDELVEAEKGTSIEQLWQRLSQQQVVQPLDERKRSEEASAKENSGGKEDRKEEFLKSLSGLPKELERLPSRDTAKSRPSSIRPCEALSRNETKAETPDEEESKVNNDNEYFLKVWTGSSSQASAKVIEDQSRVTSKRRPTSVPPERSPYLSRESRLRR